MDCSEDVSSKNVEGKFKSNDDRNNFGTDEKINRANESVALHGVDIVTSKGNDVEMKEVNSQSKMDTSFNVSFLEFIFE